MGRKDDVEMMANDDELDTGMADDDDLEPVQYTHPAPMPVVIQAPSRPRLKAPTMQIPPLWEGAAAAGGMGKLKVARFVNGRSEMLGYLPAGANEVDLLGKWSQAGSYMLTPVDSSGRTVGDAIELNISEDHETLRARSAALGIGQPTPVAGVGAAASSEVLALVERLRTASEAQLKEDREAAQAEREAAAKERAELAKERAHMAVLASHESAKLNEGVHNRFYEMMRVDREASDARYARERLDEDRRREREREEFERKAEADRVKWERERELERERVREERAAEERREDRRREQDKLDRERERELDRARTDLMLARLKPEGGDPLAPMDGLIERVMPLITMAKEAGIISVGGNKEQSLIEQGLALATALANAKAAHDQAELIRAGYVPDDGQETEQVAVTQVQPTVAQIAAVQTQAPALQQQPQAEAPESPQDERSLAERIATLPELAHMDPKAQLDARRALRNLVHALRLAEPATWKDKVILTITKTPAIIPYCQAVSVRWALIEGHAEEGLAVQIIEAVKATGLVPDTFTFDRALP